MRPWASRLSAACAFGALLAAAGALWLASRSAPLPGAEDPGPRAPASAQRAIPHRSSVRPAELHCPAFDQNAARLAAAARNEAGAGTHRFAHPLAVQASPESHGSWTALTGEVLSWSLDVVSPGAANLSLAFTDFLLPPGAELSLQRPDGQPACRPFTAEDNARRRQLWTPVTDGERIRIVATVAEAQRPALRLGLTRVHHGLWAPEKSGSSPAESCHLDTACGALDLEGVGPLIDSFRHQIRATAAFTLLGIDSCSGVLLDNTAGDGRPLFLTAHHCGVTSGNAPSMVVYWNYENSDCREPGTTGNGRRGDGSRAHFNAGAAWLASHAETDFTLVELDDPVLPEAHPFFAGWDRRTTPPDSAIAVHHPDVREKRISFSFQPVEPTEYSSFEILPDSSHLRVACWDWGTTEGGSSGGPLFNASGRVVGQLHGGDAACGNQASDWFGRLAMAWEGGGTRTSRLRDWLDPLQSGAEFLDGRFLEPSLSLEGGSAMEGDGALRFTVRLPGPSAGDVRFSLRVAGGSAAAGQDYLPPELGPFTLAPGTTEHPVLFTLIDDTAAEDDETVVLELAEVTGATAAVFRASGSIIDDDFRAPQWTGPSVFDLQQDQAFEARLSAGPRVTAWSFAGESPAGMELDSPSGLLRWTPPEPGVWAVSISASNPAGAAVRSLRFRVAANPLRLALDAPDQPWPTGSPPWMVDRSHSQQGGSSAASPPLDDGEASWIETAVEGPEDVLFWWMTSSEETYDKLVCALDGGELSALSGDSGWRREIVSVPPGLHLLRWTYRKDGSTSAGADRGWLDGVRLLSRETAPYLIAPSAWSAETGVLVEIPVRSTGSDPRLEVFGLPAGLEWNGAAAISGTPVQLGDFPVLLRTSNPFGSDEASLQLHIGVSLGTALEMPGARPHTGGDAPWTSRPDPGAAGGHAGCSGAIKDSQRSWFEIPATGPDTLVFRWRTSSEEGFDRLAFTLDGQELAALSGETGWLRRTFTLPHGNHLLRWTYAKDSSESAGVDGAWVDAVRLGARSPEPLLLSPDLLLASSTAPLELRLAATRPNTVFTATGLPAGVTLAPDGGFQGRPQTSGRYPVRITASNPHGSDSMDLELSLLPPLGSEAAAALDQPRLAWFSEERDPWFPVADPSAQDGVALRSGAIGNDRATWIETQVDGPGEVAFRWKVSSEQDFDFLRFTLDREERASLSGESGWITETSVIPPGPHLLRWGYLKDDSQAGGADAARLDAVRILGYAGWVLEHDLQELAGTLQDPDGDAVANLLEYALGLDPLRPDAHRLPEPAWSEAGLHWEIRKRAGDSRLAYAVEATDAGATPQWGSAGLQILEDSQERLVVRDPAHPPANQPRLLRIRVVWQN